MKSITAEDLKTALSAEVRPLLIDVREPEEHRYGILPGALSFPFTKLGESVEELRTCITEAGDRPVVLYCHLGGRSQRAILHLESLGITDLYNLVGGTNAYASVDSSIAKY